MGWWVSGKLTCWVMRSLMVLGRRVISGAPAVIVAANSSEFRAPMLDEAVRNLCLPSLGVGEQGCGLAEAPREFNAPGYHL